MYIDILLFIIGAVCALILVICLLHLIFSHKKSRAIKKFVKEETEYMEYSRTMQENTFDKNIGGNKQKNAEDGELISNPVRHEMNPDILKGAYIMEKRIYDGPMSTIFLAKSIKLGSRWIIKFIPHGVGDLVGEHEKLKNLTHISLPKIIDIFEDETGIYLVQSYIDGKNLRDIIKENQFFNQFLIVDWGKQLCDVYSYLHTLEESPIYHLDIKPENIMFTHGNRLVPIDFGISKVANDGSDIVAAVSPHYAAPEQFGNINNSRFKEIMALRFGNLPDDYIYWKPDARTDIFSLGVMLFELAVGEIPTVNNISRIKDIVSTDFAKIILKCIKINPSDRYQSMGELRADLQKLNDAVKNFKISLIVRKVTAVLAALFFALSAGSLLGGAYLYHQESLAIWGIEPQYMTISLQRSSDLSIEKEMPNGTKSIMALNDLTWTFSSDNIARIDGNRISGMNLGTTRVEGRHRNHLISFVVNVVEPMEGMVDIVQRFDLGRKVLLFGGSTAREHIDGSLHGEAEFVSPESIDITDDGTIYIADSGVLRKIRGSTVESIDIDPFYMTPNIVRCHKNDVYILTHEWEDFDGYKYAVVQLLEDGSAKEIYVTDAVFTAIEDFGFLPNDDNLLYFIERNAGMDAVYLKTIDLRKTDNIRTVLTLEKGTASLTFGRDGTIYLANPERGIIQYYNGGELKYFAGVTDEKAFIDGSAPLFYMPQKIKYADNALYVWDFNILRKIFIENGAAVYCITIAGEVSPEFELEKIDKEYNAESIILPNSYYTDFAVRNNAVMLTDPKRGVIWMVR